MGSRRVGEVAAFGYLFTDPSQGDNVVDPPRQGWRRGASRDEFTACQKRCLLYQQFQNIHVRQVVAIKILPPPLLV